VKLTQESYTRSVLEMYGMLESKPAPTPMVQSSDLMHKSPCSESDSKRMIGVPYREAIGSLLFLAVRTHPDIAVAVSILSKHVQCPRLCHWQGIKRVLRYLKGPMSKGLTNNGADPSHVHLESILLPLFQAVRHNMSHCSKLVDTLFTSIASCVSLDFVHEVFPHK
jgi:hypothetical protein